MYINAPQMFIAITPNPEPLGGYWVRFRNDMPRIWAGDRAAAVRILERIAFYI